MNLGMPGMSQLIEYRVNGSHALLPLFRARYWRVVVGPSNSYTVAPFSGAIIVYKSEGITWYK